MPYAFQRALHHTLEREGVFSDHPWDPGGRTKYGITEAVAVSHGYDIENLTINEAETIYRIDYWDSLGLSHLQSWRTAAEIFDTAVNTGTVRATLIAQEALRVIFEQSILRDGKMGPKTRAALNDVSRKYEVHLVAALNGFQFRHYLNLLYRGHPAAHKSIRGWMRRLLPPDYVTDAPADHDWAVAHV